MSVRFFQRAAAVVTAKTQTRERIEFLLEDGKCIEIMRVRDPRARRIKLSIDERGAHLTLPRLASLVAGERFLREHRDWLQLQLAQLADFEQMPTLRREITAELPLRDRFWSVQWRRGRYTSVSLEAETLVFTVTARAGDAALRRALREFYEAQARTDIGRWMPRYLSGLPNAPRRIQLKAMSSQWGSLSPEGNLVLDLSLVLAPPLAFEYVLVHELCHLIHHDHSPAFWREVETRCPDWRVQREYFHSEGRKLKAQLRRLLHSD